MKKVKNWNKNDWFFYVGILIIPIVQICLFYIYVNFNSVMLSFKEYKEVADDVWSYSFNGFSNYGKVLHDLFSEYVLITSLKNSLKLFVVTLIFSVLLASIFSYYIFKKYPLHSVFRIILFLPQIVSSVIMVIIFKYLAEELVPELMRKIFNVKMDGLLSNPNTLFTSVVVYSVFISYGSNMLLFSGAMSEINYATIEAGQLDGVNVFQEYVHIVFPSIWPTMITLTVITIAGIFTNQANLYTLLGNKVDFSSYVMGHYLFYNTTIATYADYPYLSTLGVLFTLVLFPISMFVRWAMYKFGPSNE